jgi:Tol biopolymer transport system component
MFLHNSDELIYVWDPLNTKEGEATQVYVANADGKVEEQVVESQPPERFLDYPVISHDDRYVLVEATSEQSNFNFDDYVGNRQPEDTRLILYDRFEHQVIDSDTHGIDPVWNR